MTPTVKVASFLEAFKKFLSYADDSSVTINTLSSFSELKSKGMICYENEPIFWHGNHSRSRSWVELFYVNDPVQFFVVKYHYEETSENSKYEVETSVFVP